MLVDRLATLGAMPGVDEPPCHRLGALVDVNLQTFRHDRPLSLRRHYTPVLWRQPIHERQVNLGRDPDEDRNILLCWRFPDVPVVTAMPDLDLVIRNGTVVTAADSATCDVGIQGGRIVALAERLPRGAHEIDAQRPPGPAGRRRQPLPHRAALRHGDLERRRFLQRHGRGRLWRHHHRDPVRGPASRPVDGRVVADYRERAKKAVIDHAFHMIVSDPSEQVVRELPGLIKDGFSSLKLFMTYPLLHLRDEQMLEMLALARRERAMVSVHAENDAMIGWMVERLLARGYTAPRYHAVSHPRLAEAEAVGRLIAMAALVDQPVVVFHVTTEGSMRAIRDAQTRGQKVFAETCPQYLFLSADHLDQPGLEGAKWMFSPPARDAADQAAMWRGIGTAPFRSSRPTTRPIASMRPASSPRGRSRTSSRSRTAFPGSRRACRSCSRKGSRPAGSTSTASSSCAAPIPPRSMACIQEGHDRGRLGCGPRDLGPGSQVEVEDATMHDATGYCPYAGMTLTGWPVTVISRGEVIVDDGELFAARGRGRLLTRSAGPAAEPRACWRRSSIRPQFRRQPDLRRRRTMARHLKIAAAQLGPIHLRDDRQAVVRRLCAMLREAHGMGAKLVVFPELALTTFFPRYWYDEIAEIDAWFEREMPNAATRPLFDLAKDLGVGFYLGYAELALEQGARIATIPRSSWRPTAPSSASIARCTCRATPITARASPSSTSRSATSRSATWAFRCWRAFDAIVGMMICNDRRWPEAYRVMGLQGVELIMLGYNTPTFNIYHPEPWHLRMFHNRLSVQAGAYQNSCWVVSTAKAGEEDGHGLIAGSCIIAPTGEIMAQALSEDDEVIAFNCDLDLCTHYKSTVFAFEKHRRIEHYGLIAAQTGIVPPP